MYEKRLLPLWADAAAKDMEFAVTQRSAIFFVKKGYAFFDKLKGRLLLQPAFNICMGFPQSEQCSQLWTLNFSGS